MRTPRRVVADGQTRACGNTRGGARHPKTRSATHSAVCATSSAVRHRWRLREPANRADAVAIAGAVSDALSAGTRPAASDEATAHPAANSATRQSIPTAPSTCVVAGAISSSAGTSRAADAEGQQRADGVDDGNLEQHEARNRPSRRADGTAERQLAGARCDVGERQARDVAGGDQQQDEHGAEEHVERRLEVAVLPLAVGEDAARPALMRSRQLSGQVANDFGDLDVSLRERCAVGELGDRHDVRPGLIRRGRTVAKRRPDLGVEERRREALRHHANHRVTVRHRAAQSDRRCRGSPPKRSLPRTVAQHGEGRLLGFFLDGEDAAEQWTID